MKTKTIYRLRFDCNTYINDGNDYFFSSELRLRAGFKRLLKIDNYIPIVGFKTFFSQLENDGKPTFMTRQYVELKDDDEELYYSINEVNLDDICSYL